MLLLYYTFDCLRSVIGSRHSLSYFFLLSFDVWYLLTPLLFNPFSVSSSASHFPPWLKNLYPCFYIQSCSPDYGFLSLHLESLVHPSVSQGNHKEIEQRKKEEWLFFRFWFRDIYSLSLSLVPFLLSLISCTHCIPSSSFPFKVQWFLYFSSNLTRDSPKLCTKRKNKRKHAKHCQENILLRGFCHRVFSSSSSPLFIVSLFGRHTTKEKKEGRQNKRETPAR